jgi:antitoxin CptB
MMERLKKLSYLSWHRGTRENDLLLGRFADACLKSMTEEELERYETLLAQPDPDIYSWIAQKKPVPFLELTSLISKIRNFYS